MVSARTHCPQCHRTSVVRLDDVFYAPNVDFFRCDSCRCMWHVEKGKDGPPSQTLLGHQTLQMAPKQAPDAPSKVQAVDTLRKGRPVSAHNLWHPSPLVKGERVKALSQPLFPSN